MTDRKKIKEFLEEKLKKEFGSADVNGFTCFVTSSNGYIKLDTIGGEDNCIVIEFAENAKEAHKNRFEDGDLLYIDDMAIDEMYEEIKKEIISL